MRYKVTYIFDDGVYRRTKRGRWKWVAPKPPRPGPMDDPNWPYIRVAGDGVAITSMPHPRPKGWWRRFVSWLRCRRGIRRSALTDVEAMTRRKGL